MRPEQAYHELMQRVREEAKAVEPKKAAKKKSKADEHKVPGDGAVLTKPEKAAVPEPVGAGTAS